MMVLFTLCGARRGGPVARGRLGRRPGRGAQCGIIGHVA